MADPLVFEQGMCDALEMKPAHIHCECGHVAKFGVGAEAHLREKHGFIVVQSVMAGRRLVPILSHPTNQED